jgi:hypothetical protein
MTTFDSFQEIRRMVETARASWAIWFKLYAYEAGGHEFALAIQLHFPLFDAIRESSQHITIMNLDALFKGRKDTHSLANLLDACEGNLMPNQAKECRAKLDSVKPLIKGVGILRGNYFGHRIRTKNRETFFAEAGLKIRDIDKLLDTADWIMWQLACAFIPKEHGITTNLSESVTSSLDDVLDLLLEKFNSVGGPSDLGKA